MDSDLHSTFDERKLISGLKNGDSKSQTFFYERYSPVLFAICCRYLGNTEEAEDTLIEGIMKIFQNIEKFDNKGSFEGWCKKVMVNHALTQIRKNKQFGLTTALSENEYEIKDFEAVNVNLEVEDLLKMITDLPLGYRTVFNLYAIEGYSHAEIAEKLGISVGTSKSQLNRARNLLQEKINESNISINNEYQ